MVRAYPVRPVVCRRAYPGAGLRSPASLSKSSSFPAACLCGDFELTECRGLPGAPAPPRAAPRGCGLRRCRAAAAQPLAVGPGAAPCRPSPLAAAAAVSAAAIGGGGGMAGTGGSWRPPRSCEDYWGEWKHCRGLRHAFHHYYAHGELPECGRWREDYEACRAWERDRAAAAQGNPPRFREKAFLGCLEMPLAAAPRTLEHTSPAAQAPA
ncbi:UPF0545 protein C22orf39 homolog isoform X2 [Serinus canaria]|uniref:UPF0545 protein C22orf39 homolog isoform X2 n=1 Tax=Serinus canaria TaxID=9135 RepID=UPI0021CCEBD9|nr:UPF0545 protein C22orf39 homolog isoform X2 [Serinus canaria]